MKKVFLLISFLFVLPLLMSFSNAKVVTEDDGRQIVIFPDGTWKEFRGDIRPKVSEHQFVLGGGDSYGIWYSPAVWSLPLKFNTPDYDVEFVHATKGAYGYVLYNKDKLSEKKLKEYALHNARQIIDELKVEVEETIEINNTKVKCLQMEGWYVSQPNIQIIYCGYYYTGAKGSVQFVVYTTMDLFPALQQDIKSLLNGFVIIPE